jgi:GLPGLI family protein
VQLSAGTVNEITMNTALSIAILCSPLSFIGQNLPPRQALIEASYAVQLNMRADKPAPPGLEGLANIQDKIEVILLCNSTTAYSSMPYPFDAKDFTEGLARIVMGAEYSFYTDISTPSHIMEVSKDDERVFVELNMDIHWTITDTVAEINGIRCVYAAGVIPSKVADFSDEKVTAWFAPEYPLPFGPQGLFGLPGLIIQAERLGKTYMLKRIRNVSADQVKVPSPGKGKYVKYADFFKK